MPFLKFEAVDHQGKLVSGTMESNSALELQRSLAQRGLNVKSIEGKAIQSPARSTVQPNLSSNSQRQTSAPEIKIQSAPVASNNHLKVTDVPLIFPIRHYFLFNRWADLTRAGFNQSDILSQFQTNVSARYNQMFSEMREATAKGASLSEEMAKRPRQFAPSIVDTVRVGETSGNLPEALANVAETSKRANAFGGFMFYGVVVIPPLIVMCVSGIALSKGSVDATRAHFNETAQRKANESDGQFGTRVLVEKTSKYKGLFYGGLIGSWVYLIIFFLLLYPMFRMLRHFLGYWMPFCLQRAKAEGLERFSWAMAAMLRAGKSPASSLHVAAGTIPNLYLRKRVLNQFGPINETEPLSSAIFRSGLINHQQKSLIETGQMVGTPDRSLDQIQEIERRTQLNYTRLAQVFGYIAGILLLGVAIGFVVGYLYLSYARNMVDMVNTAGDDPTPVSQEQTQAE